MSVLTTPNFGLLTPNARRDNTTDAVWWLRCLLLALEPTTQDSGTYANKSGFHGRGRDQIDKGQGNSGTNYSIRDGVNRTGPWWRDFSAGFDWTFTTAQSGNYTLIDIYSSRLLKSGQDASDPRLDLVLYEFYGQTDWDSHVEGWDEYHDREVTSDPSHLWHIHFSFLRSKVGDFWAMWALYTVLIGWTVDQWRASLGAQPQPPAPTPQPQPTLPVHAPGSRTLRLTSPQMTGTDILLLQQWIGPAHCGKADGIYGPNTKSGVLWYQRMRGIRPYDGIAGPKTWAPILRAL